MLKCKSIMISDEFEETRTFLLSYTKLYAQTPADQLGWLMDSKFYNRKNYLIELDQLLKKVTLEDDEVAKYQLNVKSVKIIKSEDTFK